MAEWFDPKVKLPENNQECLLMPQDHVGLTTIGVFGPITWDEQSKAWIDIFRDAEAGAIIQLDKVGLWCDWESIAPKE